MLEDDAPGQAPIEDNALRLALETLFAVSAEHFPYPILLAGADVGEILALRLHPEPTRLLFQVLYRGQVAGMIDLTNTPEILEHARKGRRFEAVVSENYDGRCKVLIRPASPAGKA